MAGSGSNSHDIKYLYFHDSNSPILIKKTPAVCAPIPHEESIASSPTSPWIHPSPMSGDNDDSLSPHDIRPPVPTGPMSTQPSFPSLTTDGVLNTNQQSYENYGHFFVKKNFHKPTYCHHCLEMLWGLMGQGYNCEGKRSTFLLFFLSMRARLSSVCNFISHDRCRKSVISPCSSIAPILIRVSLSSDATAIERLFRVLC
jgi:hypothetical protein